jgi:hypothetical protein
MELAGWGMTQRSIFKTGLARIRDLLWSTANDGIYDVVVVSYGGSGTTFLIDFLSAHTTVNSPNSLEDGIKHIISPKHPVLDSKTVKKAVYVYGDPIEATLSLFRRDFVKFMIPKINSREHHDGASLVDYRDANVRDVRYQDYLDNGCDELSFEEHWKNWTSEDIDFPILFVKFDAIHDRVEDILNFLKLPLHLAKDFPPKIVRSSDLRKLPKDELAALQRIYGALQEDMALQPDLHIKSRS